MRRQRLLVLAFGLALVVLATPVYAQSGAWSAPKVVSDPEGSAWFPDLTAGPAGSIHVVWTSDVVLDAVKGIGADLLLYRELRDGQWSAITDIANPYRGGSRYAIRSSIALGHDGRLHALVRGPRSMEHMSAPEQEALSARSWLISRNLSSGLPYYASLTVDGNGTLHAVWNSTGSNAECPQCQDIFYRHSTDGGTSWSPAVQLSEGLNDAVKPQVKVDRANIVHVVWEERALQQGGSFQASGGLYRRSIDNGLSWQDLQLITLPEQPGPRPRLPRQGGTPAPEEAPDQPVQLTLGMYNSTDPVLIFRSSGSEQVYSQVSRDHGASWSKAEAIRTVQARRFDDTPFDAYATTTDGSGNVHLVIVGRLAQETNAALNPRLLHLFWNGRRWSSPQIVAIDDRYPEWPRVLASGNRLHVVWFTRNAEDRFGSGMGQPVNYRVWYSSRLVAGPPVAELPIMTPAPAGPTATPAPAGTTPTPTLSPVGLEGPPLQGAPTWELQGYATILLALLPTLGLMLLLVGSRFMRRKR